MNYLNPYINNNLLLYMDLNNQQFNLETFTENTKKLCTFSAISIFLIFIFIITPLSKFNMLSKCVKVLILLLLVYTIFLNLKQIKYLTNSNQTNTSNEVKQQLNINIISSYIFTLFIGLIIIFILKSFF